MTVPPPGDGNGPGRESGSEPGYGSAPGYDPYHSAPGSSYPPPGYGLPAGVTPAGAAPVCTWHPDRQTNLSCTRCGRPACPECLTPATVGFHCRACVAESRGTQRVARTHAGSRVDEQPIVSYVLIAVNVLVFLVTAVQSRSVMTMSGSVFDGGLLVPGVVAHGEYWRLVTSGFLHIGIIHLAVNMLSLYWIGPTLERFVGRVRFLVIYLMSLLGGSVAVLLLTGNASSTAGASGAIFGLLGALGVTFTRYKIDLRQLAIVLVLNLWVSFQFSGISWQGHIGGLIVGAIVGAAMVYAPKEHRTAWQAGITGAVLVVLVALIWWRAGQIPECFFDDAGALWCYRA